ncbi:MAG: transposase [Pirellulales bacterium]|nr:transposase [Pirellulales bacterium]
MNDRQNKGIELALNSVIKRDGFLWIVPSSTGSGKYRVDLDSVPPRCTCPDHMDSGNTCKHIYAARYAQHHKGKSAVSVNPEAIQRPTYPQNWPAYNAAQTSEKRLFLPLLHRACQHIEEPVQTGRGRPRIPLRDLLLSVIYKVYTTISCRRFISDLTDAHERGLISRLPHFNSLFHHLRREEFSPAIHRLIQITSLPLAAIERQFAADSTGFTTSKFYRWHDEKWGGERKAHQWVKVHAMCGVRTNVVTAAVIAGMNAGDAPQFPEMLSRTTENFTVDEVSADKAYLSRANVKEVGRQGAVAFIPLKIDSVCFHDDDGTWQDLFHRFSLQRDEFDRRYHLRSNVESTFSAVKRKFGDHIRSKNETAMKNEALCKLVCQNISCVVHAMTELGIEPSFSCTSSTDEQKSA